MIHKLPFEIIRYISLYCTDVVNDRNGIYISKIPKNDERYKILDNFRYRVYFNNRHIRQCKKHPTEELYHFDDNYFKQLSLYVIPNYNWFINIKKLDIIKMIEDLESLDPVYSSNYFNEL